MEGDIDFEEQLALEELEREKEKKKAANIRTDPDGTKYEWDEDKKAWFPMIDQNFIAQYQMNYGREGDPQTSDPSNTATSDPGQAGQGVSDYDHYHSYYQHYYNATAQQEAILGRKKVAKTVDSHDDCVDKLEQLENTIEEQAGQNVDGTEQPNDMANYTPEQIKQYNDYWSYYYGTEYHDYYADCMKQGQGETNTSQGQNGDKGEGQEKETAENKKGKKRKGAPEPQRPEGWFSIEEDKNTNVFVSGMPLDVTEEEFRELMTKFGLVMYDPRTKKPKLKLYRDEKGEPKGEGRCCYIKVESVELALKILDGSDVRGHTIQVERAQFQMKGEFDPSKRKKKLTNKEKKKQKENMEKLFDWRPERPRGARMKYEKTVVMKNVFEPKTFEEDPLLINGVRNDVRTECAKLGEVKKVTVYDRHQDGIVTVTFKEAEEADSCVEYMNHRYFAQRRIMVATWDGQTKYDVEESEAEREKRLSKWADFLDSDGKATPKSTSDTAPSGGASGDGAAVTSSGENSNPTGDSVEVPTVDQKSEAVSGTESVTESSSGTSDTTESADS